MATITSAEFRLYRRHGFVRVVQGAIYLRVGQTWQRVAVIAGPRPR